MTRPTPWAAMLAAGVSLGVAQYLFWRLSLREWRALIAPLDAGAMSRAAFDALAQRFPDAPT